MPTIVKFACMEWGKACTTSR